MRATPIGRAFRNTSQPPLYTQAEAEACLDTLHPVVFNWPVRVAEGFDATFHPAGHILGAPNAPAAGVELQVHVGDIVEAGTPVMTVHAEVPGELAYALGYLSRHPDLMCIDDLDTEAST